MHYFSKRNFLEIKLNLMYQERNRTELLRNFLSLSRYHHFDKSPLTDHITNVLKVLSTSSFNTHVNIIFRFSPRTPVPGFLQILQLQFCMHLAAYPCTLYVCCISFSLIFFFALRICEEWFNLSFLLCNFPVWFVLTYL
jgi:hypothetical protein